MRKKLAEVVACYLSGADKRSDFNVSRRLAFLVNTGIRWANSNGLEIEAKDLLAGLVDKELFGSQDVSRLMLLLSCPIGTAPYFNGEAARLGLAYTGDFDVVGTAALLLAKHEAGLVFPIESKRQLDLVIPNYLTRLLYRSEIKRAAECGQLPYKDFRNIFDLPKDLIPVPSCQEIADFIGKSSYNDDDTLLFWRLTSGLPEVTSDSLERAREHELDWQRLPAKFLLQRLLRP